MCSIVSKNAVIVGGGPAGLASAIMLSKRGWENVTVLDLQEDIGSYDPSLGFVFMIDGRGVRALRQIDDAAVGALQRDAAAGSSTNVMRVFGTDGSMQETKMEVNSCNYWIARHLFIRLLYKVLLRTCGEAVKIMSSTKCTGVSETGGQLVVYTEDANGKADALNADLVIAADGIKSAVRTALCQQEPEKYRVVRAPSPAGGLLYKVLTLPQGFQLPGNYSFPPDRDGTVQIHAVAGALAGREQNLRLGLLPAVRGADVCTANIIRVSEHKIWKVKTAEELLDLLTVSFPQLGVKEIIPSEEAERFVKARPGKFPDPQYCATLHKVIESEKGPSKAVVFLGDAAHAFPPDLGQGVNSALQDVEALDRALQASGEDVGKAATIYNAERLPQAAALVRLMQFGGPFQYKQSHLGDTLWRLNILLRMILNKIAPRFFSKAAFLLITDKNLTYTDVLGQANRTTRNIFITAVTAVMAVVALAVKFLTVG